MTTIERENLPLWMQKTLRRTDWGALIVIAFSLLAAWSFLLQSGLPRTNASEHYAYRAADTAAGFAEGRLYPRWSANVLGGYGAPIPNYTAPAAAYFPALIDTFVTNEATLAVRLVYVLAFVGAGAAVYAFVLRRSGAVAAVIAALLYVYSPYVGLTVPQLLGDLPGMIGLALIPALLWSVDRLLRVNRPSDVLIVGLITAGLAFTDLRALGIGWLIAIVLIEWNHGAIRRSALALGSGAVGIALAACFWLPALVEADAVRMAARPRAIPFSLTLAGLLTPLRQLDPGALIAQPQFTLGIGITAFAARGRLRHRPVGRATARLSRAVSHPEPRPHRRHPDRLSGRGLAARRDHALLGDHRQRGRPLEQIAPVFLRAGDRHPRGSRPRLVSAALERAAARYLTRRAGRIRAAGLRDRRAARWRLAARLPFRRRSAPTARCSPATMTRRSTSSCPTYRRRLACSNMRHTATASRCRHSRR